MGYYLQKFVNKRLKGELLKIIIVNILTLMSLLLMQTREEQDISLLKLKDTMQKTHPDNCDDSFTMNVCILVVTLLSFN